MVFKKPNWGPPPEGYIAGLGRGATGFITRGDIGPSRLNEQTFTDAKTGQTISSIGAPPGLSRGNGAKAPQVVDEGPSNDAQFDEWNGFEGTNA